MVSAANLETYQACTNMGLIRPYQGVKEASGSPHHEPLARCGPPQGRRMPFLFDRICVNVLKMCVEDKINTKKLEKKMRLRRNRP